MILNINDLSATILAWLLYMYKLTHMREDKGFEDGCSELYQGDVYFC